MSTKGIGGDVKGTDPDANFELARKASQKKLEEIGRRVGALQKKVEQLESQTRDKTTPAAAEKPPEAGTRV